MLLIFDLDGTLYKTHKTCIAVLRQLCEKYCLKVEPEDESLLMCTTLAVLLEKIAPEMPDSLKKSIGQEFKWLEIELVKQMGELFEGAKELLTSLKEKGHSLAICGMGSAEYIDSVLNTCNIKELFDYVYPRQDGKTKSQVLSQLLSASNEKKEDCVIIGDSITDLTAARGNSIPFIGVSYGYGAKGLESTVIADSIDGIEGIINQFSVFSDIYKDALQGNKPLLIGVNGVDTSGKTVFSERLKCYFKALGHDTLLVQMDDFHNKRDFRMSDPSPMGYLENAFDTKKLELLLSEIKKGSADVTLELLDLDTDQFTNIKSYKTDNDTVVIVEGVLLYRPPLSELFGYKVFLDIDFDEVLNRARERDVPKYGEEFLEKYKSRYIPAQKIYLKEYMPKESCDILIDNTDYNNPKICRLKRCEF